MPPFSELELLTSAFAPGLTVIEASAGTGKTYSISHLVPRLLLEGALPDLSKLLLLTFTKDAARELAERVRRVLTRLAAPAGPDEAAAYPHISALRPLAAEPAARARLDRALLDLDLLAVSTIHAFCQRTLQQEGSLCGLPVLPEVTTDDAEYLTPIVRELWLATLATDPTLAALATAQAWDLDGALKLINTLRRAQQPQPEPAVPPFAALRATLAALCQTLAAPEPVAAISILLGRVSGWNAGVDGTADALSRVHSLSTAAPHELAFWQGVAAAAELPKKITARKNDAKALKAEVAAHPWFAALDKLQSLVRRLEWSWQQQLAAEALPKLADVMTRHRLITQDGLIGALYRALHRSGPEGTAQSARLAAHLAERYQVALIDESQDTDPRQLAIFARIFLARAHPRRLIFVGDPKQAIYGFRGADLSAYLAARAHADAGYTLTQTYRAPAPLVATINRLFARSGAFHHAEMVFPSAVSALSCDRQLLRGGVPCSRLEAWIAPAEDSRTYSAKGNRVPALSARVASTIVELLRIGELRTTDRTGCPTKTERVSPHDCAILVATNAQAEAMATALLERGVPVVVNSGADVFASEEARELHTLLRAVLDPRRTPRLRSALATRLLGVDAPTLASLDGLDATGEQPSVFWQAQFLRWNERWTRFGLATLLADLDRLECPVTRRLALVPLTGERRATNYRHLTDLLLEANREEAPRPAEIVCWLGQQIAHAEERSQAEERQLQLSSDREAVQVVTMHKAKGLEYPLVFCPYLADPLRESKGVAQLPAATISASAGQGDLLVNFELLDDTAKAERTRQQMAAQLEERLRLTYVALTRAQVRLWICSYSSARSDLGSPIDWLLRPEAETTSHPAYSPDWVTLAKGDRGARHIAALRSLGAQAHEEALGATVAALITYRPPPPETKDLYLAPAATSGSAPELSALASPLVPPSWRITSFSTLTKERHAHGAPLRAPGLDTADAPASVSPGAGVAVPGFLSAPAGAAVGTAVHDWIETWDMSPPAPAALAHHLAAARLPAPGPDQPAWEQTLGTLFTDLRLIRLPGCGEAPLHELCPEPHGSEWHFHLPLAGDLTVGALAHCFALHAAPAHRPYAPLLAALSEDRFQGLLQGFIDRLVRHDSTWGVIDWKTNRLGAGLGDYDEAALLRCAMESHYLLQAHLYLVALRRYLRALGVADTAIAGAWLVFLRAIAPDTIRGVLHIKPPDAMLDALDALFAPAARPVA
ncbi:MAG: UvrD-helicase domain-containing protein [Opitutaceae bacterium]|nr:UvrD-helicase domain-containing protein [Opitutaceae bacterium]